MIDKEAAELRRQLRYDRNSISTLCGCYVNETREIIATFKQPFQLLEEAEAEKYLTIFRKTLAGAIGKTLTDIDFSTEQVLNGEEHKLLTALKNSVLEDEEAVKTFYQKIIDNIEIDGNYLILLAVNAYDVFRSGKDGSKDEDSDQVFTYILCAVCPVKMEKSTLSYDAQSKSFRNRTGEWTATAPALGFLFPAFDGRATNIYGALYYTAKPNENHPEFADAIFHTSLPMPATEQKETFNNVIGDALAETCSYPVVRTVHTQLKGLIEEHKASKNPEPLFVSKCEVRSLLKSCGVPEERAEKFEEEYDDSFGASTDLRPQVIIDTNRFEVKTSDVSIKVNPERTDLVETRVIDGQRYLMILANDHVEVNGITIGFPDKDEDNEAGGQPTAQ